MKRFVDGREIHFPESPDVEVTPLFDRLAVRGKDGTATAVAVKSGSSMLVSYRGRQFRIERSQSRPRSSRGGESGKLFAPMPGQIVDVRVSVGEEVRDGDKILVLEAMKTQQAFVAPFAGTVAQLLAATGDQVEEGQLLAVLVPLGS